MEGHPAPLSNGLAVQMPQPVGYTFDVGVQAHNPRFWILRLQTAVSCTCRSDARIGRLVLISYHRFASQAEAQVDPGGRNERVLEYIIQDHCIKAKSMACSEALVSASQT